MIYFFADNHYGKHPGKVIYENLPNHADISFFEDDWTVLESGSWVENCDLLILNLIGGTCGVPHPGPGAEQAVRTYCEKGGNILLLHGSSAAFWEWNWWRPLPGLRWVRPGDPDGIPASCHPHAPCKLTLSKTRHPLIADLREVDLPEDEIYINLEQVSPVMTLMETVVDGRTYPECLETVSPWNGKFVSFIPGHLPECTKLIAENVSAIIRYLIKEK